MGMTWDSTKCHGGSVEREGVLMNEIWGRWGWPPRVDGIWIGLERLNGFSLHEVKEDMRVRAWPKVGYMLRNKICRGGGLKCGRRHCQAVECRQYLLLKILEQVNVNRKQGGCGNTYGSGKWLGQWKETCWVVFQRLVAIQLRWWRPGPGWGLRKEEAAMYESHFG